MKKGELVSKTHFSTICCCWSIPNKWELESSSRARLVSSSADWSTEKDKIDINLFHFCIFHMFPYFYSPFYWKSIHYIFIFFPILLAIIFSIDRKHKNGHIFTHSNSMNIQLIVGTIWLENQLSIFDYAIGKNIPQH